MRRVIITLTGEYSRGRICWECSSAVDPASMTFHAADAILFLFSSISNLT